jgi:hypothetical protein
MTKVVMSLLVSSSLKSFSALPLVRSLRPILSIARLRSGRTLTGRDATPFSSFGGICHVITTSVSDYTAIIANAAKPKGMPNRSCVGHLVFIMDFADMDNSVIFQQEIYNRELQFGQEFVNALMSEDAIQKIPGESQMRVIKNLRCLETGERDSYFSPIIRDITEPFWQPCINIVETPGCRYRVCAVGTPGIGKTTDTSYLIRMLLLMNKTVVYHIRTVEKWMDI